MCTHFSYERAQTHEISLDKNDSPGSPNKELQGYSTHWFLFLVNGCSIWSVACSNFKGLTSHKHMYKIELLLFEIELI